MKFRRKWKKAWVLDTLGEVFPAKYSETSRGEWLIKAVSGQMTIGYSDGTSDIERIKRWWPDDPEGRPNGYKQTREKAVGK